MRSGSPGLKAARVLGAALALALQTATQLAHAEDDAAARAPASRPEENAEFNAEAVAAAAPFLPELEKLGQWCSDSTLMLRRSHVAETLIHLNPEHELGHKWLRHKRQPDGSWWPTSVKPFYDEKPAALPEWEKRRAALAERMRSALEPLIDRRDDWRTAGVRSRLLRALVAIEPDDAELHDRAGEVLSGKKWILKESAATADGRRRIREAAAAASADAAAAAPGMQQGASPQGTSLGTPEFTVHSSLDRGEVRALAMRVVAARRLFERVLDVHTSYQPGFVVFAFPSHDAAMAYVRTRTDLTTEQLRFAQGCWTFWLRGHEVVLSAPTAVERTDECVRQVLSTQVGAPQELIRSPAWIGEGAGMYLTYALVGTRLTPFIVSTKYADESRRKELADPKCDWVQAVRRQVVEKAEAPRLRILTSLPLNSMTPDDTLMAYALAAYFLEGRPADLTAMLIQLKTGASFHQALADTCGLDADALEARFVRWLRETK